MKANKTPRGTARALRRASAAKSLNIGEAEPSPNTFAGRAAAWREGFDNETLARYDDLREEGYPRHQAMLMAGMSDPPE